MKRKTSQCINLLLFFHVFFMHFVLHKTHSYFTPSNLTPKPISHPQKSQEKSVSCSQPQRQLSDSSSHCLRASRGVQINRDCNKSLVPSSPSSSSFPSPTVGNSNGCAEDAALPLSALFPIEKFAGLYGPSTSSHSENATYFRNRFRSMTRKLKI